MRELTRYLAAAAVMAAVLCVCPPAAGQDYVAPPVTVSKEKVKVDGKICYTHIVLEKQTLYSISKAYNVSVEDIYAFNPGLRENGLKKNSIIIIPSPEAAADRNAGSAGEHASSSGGNAGAVSENASASGGSTGVSTGNGPGSGVRTDDNGKASADPGHPSMTHTVRWYEDIESIAEKYGVSADAIIHANNLKSRELKSRQKLIIPEHGDSYAAADSAGESAPDTESTEAGGEEQASGDSERVTFTAKNSLNVALLLPLKAGSDKPGTGNFDFYCGVLLAARELGMNGVNVNLDVKDISAEKPENISKKLYRESDVIIGPVSSADIAAVYTSAGCSPYIVSPLDQKASSLLASHPTLIQAPSSYEAQYRDLCSWLKEDMTGGDKLLIISEKTSSVPANVKLLKKAISETGIDGREISYSILEGRKIIDSLRPAMSAEGTTRVVICSESEAFVNDVLRNLNLLIHEEFRVVLYGQSKFRSFDTIEVENFHNANMHVCLPYYIDYDSPEVMQFIKRYRALFKTEPTQYAFQGYDVALYFMQLCAEYGDGWPAMLPECKRDMLQASFDFPAPASSGDGEAAGGAENAGVRRVVYETGYSITRK